MQLATQSSQHQAEILSVESELIIQLRFATSDNTENIH